VLGRSGEEREEDLDEVRQRGDEGKDRGDDADPAKERRPVRHGPGERATCGIGGWLEVFCLGSWRSKGVDFGEELEVDDLVRDEL